MEKDQVKALKHGLYKAKWKKSHGGGSSLVAVGSGPNGDKWIAPTNWISGSTFDLKVWNKIKKVKLIKGKK